MISKAVTIAITKTTVMTLLIIGIADGSGCCIDIECIGVNILEVRSVMFVVLGRAASKELVGTMMTDVKFSVLGRDVQLSPSSASWYPWMQEQL